MIADITFYTWFECMYGHGRDEQFKSDMKTAFTAGMIAQRFNESELREEIKNLEKELLECYSHTKSQAKHRAKKTAE